MHARVLLTHGRSLMWLLALALLLLSTRADAADTRDLTRPAKAVIFRAAGFPTVDAPVISDRVLDEALAKLPVDELHSVAELKERLRLQDYDALVLPYGSAFPLDAWSEIRAFIKNGGGLVVLGGAPFHQPVLQTAKETWQLGTRQPTFAHEFLIGPAEAVNIAAEWTPTLPNASWSLTLPRARTIWELTVRLGTRPDLPQESGSEAYRDAVVRPLVHYVDRHDIARACPLLEIDRLRGDDAGARWILATSDAPLDATLIRAMVQRALAGASELDARPIHASVQPTEPPLIRIRALRPIVRTNDRSDVRTDVVVRDDLGREVHRTAIDLTETREAVVAIQTESPLAPGLYHVDVTTSSDRTTTGFWVHDSALLTKGPRVTVSRDWLRRNGEVFPVIGTTYMASDVHRKFLFEPNPHVWDRDFKQMSRLGINFVRTGLWTAWSRAMLDPGVVDEAFLRALDAYVQSAAKHGIVVNFTFFAFLPPAYGGSNPYLDPRSLEGQRALLTAIAHRYRGVGWIHYDLINEPSYAPPEGLWSNRPIRDAWERRAWEEWIRARHGDDLNLLRNRWQDPTDDLLGLPSEHEIWHAPIRETRRPRKVRDFVLFSQDVVAGWARALRDILRDAGGDVLVTLGQDEGGTWTRSSQQLHADAIDYTCLHPWWQNDDLLASGVFVKVPEKPSLFQETGLMRLEDVDGWPWRSPAVAASVIEAKYAYAFASRAAGSIEWAWNINPYMAIDNESVIGFFRPDGTAKPELQVVLDFAEFFRVAQPWLDDYEPDPVVIVIPHSRLFLNRPAATDGFRRMIRVMAERFGVVPTAISDLRLTAERLRNARLVIVPSAEFLDAPAAEALLAASRGGTKILFTGAITGDSYGEVPSALEALGVVDRGRAVKLREHSTHGWATFDRNLRENLLRSVREQGPSLRNIWHEPLPLEHAREDGPLVELLRATFDAAGVETHPSDHAVAARLLKTQRAMFAVLVNETASDARRRVAVGERIAEIPVPAGRSRLVLFDRTTGRVVAQTPGEPVVMLKP